MLPFITILIFTLGVILIFENPINFLYLIIVDSMMTNRFYNSIGDLPIILFWGFILIISISIHKRKIIFDNSILSKFVYAFSLYIFISYYSYFQILSFDWLNNGIIYLLLFSTINKLNWTVLRKISIVLIITGWSVGVLFIISQVNILGDLLGNARQVAFYLLLIFPFVFLLYNDPEKKVKRSFLIATLVFLSISILVGRGRITIFLLFIILIYYLLYIEKKSGKMVIFGIFALSSLMISTDSIRAYFESIYFRSGKISYNKDFLNSDAFTEGRTSLQEDAIRMFTDNPVFGYGFMSFKAPDNPYNRWTGGFRKEGLSVHNTHLQYLAELGIVGYGIYMFMLFYAFIISLRMIKKVRYNHSTIYFNVGSITIISVLLFIIGSITDNHGFHYRYFPFFIFLTVLAYKQLSKESDMFNHFSHTEKLN